MDLKEINNLYKQIEFTLSALVKLCPNCNSLFKDSLVCKECNREDKIVKILNEKS